jgi:hypothetical protein
MPPSRLLIGFLAPAIFFVGCSGRAVQTDLPLTHPAHPQAVESVYGPPPDVFQNSRLEAEMKRHGGRQEKMPAAHSEPMDGGHAGHGTESQPSSAGHGSPAMDHSDKPHTGHGQ